MAIGVAEAAGWENVRAPSHAELRHEVRAFLQGERESGSFLPTVNSWLTGFSAEFSEKLGQRGWIGMTWPKRYGGGERSQLERFAVLEELLAAGAPVAAHWISDRQVGPSLLRHGTEAQKAYFLPAIAAGRCFFAIGMTEPDAGSDLAAIRTRATPDPAGGWRISGSKIWTTFAHRAEYALVLARSSERNPDARHDGMTQFIVDLGQPGVTVSPIESLDGEAHFNEVVFEDAFAADDRVLGEVGNGWSQTLAELVNERSGPERFLSVLPLFSELLALNDQNSHTQMLVGEMVARVWATRAMSVRVALALEDGGLPVTEAAMVKDVGTELEQDMIEMARSYSLDNSELPPATRRLLDAAVQNGPAFTIRGGTTEILRGIVAEGLGGQ